MDISFVSYIRLLRMGMEISIVCNVTANAWIRHSQFKANRMQRNGYGALNEPLRFLAISGLPTQVSTRFADRRVADCSLHLRGIDSNLLDIRRLHNWSNQRASRH